VRFPWGIKLPRPSGVVAGGCRGGEEATKKWSHGFPPEAGERMATQSLFGNLRLRHPLLH
jgi:hypothetical protein